MRTLADLPDGWTVWNDEADGRAVVVFRPDVFDSEAFPAACLPTVHVTRGDPQRRPPAERARADTWHVTVYLEPEVTLPAPSPFPDRGAAVDGAVDAAERFVAGEFDLRGAYQVPREAYLDRLTALVGDG